MKKKMMSQKSGYARFIVWVLILVIIGSGLLFSFDNVRHSPGPVHIVYGTSKGLLSADGQYLVTATDTELQVFDLENQVVIQSVQLSPPTQILGWDYHPHDPIIGILGRENFIQVNLDTLIQETISLPFQQKTGMSLEYHPTRSIISIVGDGKITIYDFERSIALFEFPIPGDHFPATAFSPSGNYFAYGYEYLDRMEGEIYRSGKFVVVDLNTGELPINRDDIFVSGGSRMIRYFPGLSWHPDERRIAVNLEAMRLDSIIFDIDTQNITMLAGSAANGIVFSSDGNSLYTMNGPYYGALVRWDSTSGRRLQEFEDGRDISFRLIQDYQSPYLLTYFLEEYEEGGQSGLEVWRVD